MLPSRHIIVSVPLGALLIYFTQDIITGMVCFIFGVLIDVDHIIEYIIHRGFSKKVFSLPELYRSCERFIKPEEQGGVKRLYLIFHMMEAAVLLWALYIITRNLYIFSAALGYSGHLLLDALYNKLNPRIYFLTQRIRKGFLTVHFRKAC
ncbi:MAG: hypothetical protein V1662_03160 [Candidatus Omnitrophota bacterium]